MIAVYLYLWLTASGWHYAGEFKTQAACHAAAKELGAKRYRCVGAIK